MPKQNILLTILPLTWPNMPPIGLGFLQAFLTQKGIEADIVDFNNIFYNLADRQLQGQWAVSCNTFLEENVLSIIEEYHQKELEDAIKKMLDCDVIGFSCFKSNFVMTLNIAELLRSKKDTIKIIFGGPEITRWFFKTDGKFTDRIRQSADYLIAGEGEIPLYNYLSVKSNNEKVAKFEQLDDLSRLPFPRYDELDLSAYPKKNAIPIQFSRGCIRRCNFCSERLLYKGFRTREVNSLIEEIKYHKISNNTQCFVFYDSLINANLEKLEEFCNGIIGHFGSIHWEAQIAVRNDMPQKLFGKMKQSGCYSLFVGLESASNTTLKNMNKGFNREEALGFFKSLHRAKLFFGVSIIVGYPYETGQDFQETLDFIIQHRDMIPQIAQVNPFTYYYGTTADKDADYKTNSEALERMEVFVGEIKRHKIKYTNAFIGNLIEK